MSMAMTMVIIGAQGMRSATRKKTCTKYIGDEVRDAAVAGGVGGAGTCTKKREGVRETCEDEKREECA